MSEEKQKIFQELTSVRDLITKEQSYNRRANKYVLDDAALLAGYWEGLQVARVIIEEKRQEYTSE